MPAQLVSRSIAGEGKSLTETIEMKLLGLLLFVGITNTYGQGNLYGKKIGSPLVLHNGLLIVVGDTIHFGKGTLPNGSFNYVTRLGNVLTGLGKIPLTSQWSGRYAIVKSIRAGEGKKYVIVKAGRNAVIDITSASRVAEVVGINKSSLTLVPIQFRGDYR